MDAISAFTRFYVDKSYEQVVRQGHLSAWVVAESTAWLEKGWAMSLRFAATRSTPSPAISPTVAYFTPTLVSQVGGVGICKA
jgi:hypothetical protein